MIPFKRLGVMQGRLSAQETDSIQSFPWNGWREEFQAAKRLGLGNIEWTVDSFMLRNNPIGVERYYKEIVELSNNSGVEYRTLTADFVMQDPFWRHRGDLRRSLLNDLDFILCSMARHSSKILVLPLVDNSSCKSELHLSDLRNELTKRNNWLRNNNIKIAFETDLKPDIALDMIERYPVDIFGINYDIGNSAALGYDPDYELGMLGHRVINVHIKDRMRNSGTVPLGTGHANIPRAVQYLLEMGYQGKFILQTARIRQRSPSETIAQYIDYLRENSLLEY